MIQSGTGKFENIEYYWDGKTVTLSHSITFPKAFSNPPVIVVNVLGAGLDFSARGATASDGGTVVHTLRSYKLTSTKIGTKNFTVNLEAVPIDIPPLKTTTVDINGILIEFSWIAYDEVTIGA